MFYLINTFVGGDNKIGAVISSHRTEDSAEKANRLLQRSLSNRGHYLPTTIIESEKRYKKQDWFPRSED
jgi:hypothetical protein